MTVLYRGELLYVIDELVDERDGAVGVIVEIDDHTPLAILYSDLEATFNPTDSQIRKAQA